MSRMMDRGETLTAIAEVAGVKLSEVRAVLKSGGAQPGAASDARGAARRIRPVPRRTAMGVACSAMCPSCS